MAQAFDFTANINFAVSGIQNAAIDIKRKLGTIQGSVKIDIPKGITSNLDGINQKLTAMRTNLDNVTSSATSATNAMIALSNSFRGLNTHLSTIKNAAPAATQRMKEHSAVIQKTTLDMEEFGRISGLAFRRFVAFSIPAAFTAGITMGLRAATKEAVDFQNAMIQLQQVTGQTQYGLKDLENTIGNLSMSMGVSSKELSQVARILAQAGLSAKDTKVAMEAIAATDVAPTFENMTETTEGAIAAMQQFGIGADELKGKLGSLNAVAAAFAVESSDIISAIRHTGGAFKAAGGDLEQLIALFTSVRQTTRESADSIATGFRTIFTRMQRPRTIEFLKEIGVNLQDMSGQFVRPYEAVRRLHEAMKDLSSTDIRYPMIMEELGGYRQISKVVPLIQKFDVAQKAYAVAMAGTNSLVDAQTLAMDSLARKFTMAKEEWLKLIREMMSNQAIKNLINDLLKLSSTMVELVRNLEPMIPIFKNLALIQTARFAMALIPGIKNIHQPGQQPPKLGQSLTGMSYGGQAVKRYAGGGYVPGPIGAGDIVPAMMEPGEFVVKRSSAEKIGYDNLHKWNKAGKISHNTGGKIQKFASGGTPDEDLFIRMYGKRVYDEKMERFFAGKDVDYTPFRKTYTNLRNTPFSFIDERKIALIKQNKFLESLFDEQSELLGRGYEGTAWTKGQDVYRLGAPVTANAQDLLNFQKYKISRYQHPRILQPDWFTQIGNISRNDLAMNVQGYLDSKKNTTRSFPLFLERMRRIIPFDKTFGSLPIASMLKRELAKSNLNYWDNAETGTNFGYNPYLKRFQVYDPGAVRLPTPDDLKVHEASTFAMAGFSGGGFVQRFDNGGQSYQPMPRSSKAYEYLIGKKKVGASWFGKNTAYTAILEDIMKPDSGWNKKIIELKLMEEAQNLYSLIKSGTTIEKLTSVFQGSRLQRAMGGTFDPTKMSQTGLQHVQAILNPSVESPLSKTDKEKLLAPLPKSGYDVFLGRNLQDTTSFGGLFLKQDATGYDTVDIASSKYNDRFKDFLGQPINMVRSKFSYGFIQPTIANELEQKLKSEVSRSLANIVGQYDTVLKIPKNSITDGVLKESGLESAIGGIFESFINIASRNQKTNTRWDVGNADKETLSQLFGDVARNVTYLDIKTTASKDLIQASDISILSKAISTALEQPSLRHLVGGDKSGRIAWSDKSKLKSFGKNIFFNNIHPDDFVFEEHNGGLIKRFARGGESEDTVPALLTPGEFVFTKAASQSIGYSNLNTLNREGLGGLSKVRGYAKGGYVQRFAAENEERKVLPQISNMSLKEIRKESLQNIEQIVNAGHTIVPTLSGITIENKDINMDRFLTALLSGTKKLSAEIFEVLTRKVLENYLTQSREVIQQLEQQSKQTQTTSRRGWNKNPRTGKWTTERQLEQEKIRQIAEEMGLEVRETKTGEQRFYGYTRGGKRGRRMSAEAVLTMAEAREKQRENIDIIRQQRELQEYDDKLAKQTEKSKFAKKMYYDLYSSGRLYEREQRIQAQQNRDIQFKQKSSQKPRYQNIDETLFWINLNKTSTDDFRQRVKKEKQMAQWKEAGYFREGYIPPEWGGPQPKTKEIKRKYGRDEAFTGGLINIRQPSSGRFGGVPSFAGGAFGGAGFGGLGGTMLLSMIAGQFSDDKSSTGQMVQKLAGWGAGFAATKMLTNLGIEQQATKAIGTLFGDKQGRLEWKTLGILEKGGLRYNALREAALESGMSKEAAKEYAKQQITSIIPTNEEIKKFSLENQITEAQATKQLYQENMRKAQKMSRKQRIGIVTAGVTSVAAPLLATGFTMYGGSQQEEARKRALEIGSNPAELAKLESQYKTGNVFSKMGVGLGTGAAIGGLFGGPIGAAIGAGVGAGAGLIMALSENTNEIKKLNSQGIAAQAATNLNDIFTRIASGKSLSLYGDTEALKGSFNTQIQEIKNTAALGESTKDLTIQLKAAAPAADYLKNELIKSSSSVTDFWDKLSKSGIDLIDIFSRINNIGTEQVRKMLERDAKEGIEREQNSRKLKGVLVESELTQRAFRTFTYQLEQLSESITQTATTIDTIIGYQNPGNITAATYRSTGIFARAGAAEFVNMEDYGQEVQKLYGNLPNVGIKEWIMEIGKLSQTLPDILQGAVKAGVGAEDLGTQVQKALNVNPAAPDLSPIGITRRVISEQINSMMASRQASNSLGQNIAINVKEVVTELFKDTGKTTEFVQQQSKLLESTTKQLAGFYQQQTQQLITAEEQRLNIVKQTVTQEEMIAGMRAGLMKEPLSPEFTLRGIQRQQSATLTGTGIGNFNIGEILGGVQRAQNDLLSLQFRGNGISVLGTGKEKTKREAEDAFTNHMKAMQASQLEVDKFKRALTGVIEASDKMINAYKAQIDKIQQDREARFGILTRYAGAPFEEQQKILRTIAQTRIIAQQGQQEGGKFFWGQTADDRSSIINLAQSLSNTQAGVFGGITGTQFIERFINDRLGGRINKNLGVFQGASINAQDLIKENASITEFNRKQEEYIGKIGEWQGKQIEAMQALAKMPQDAAISIGAAITAANTDFLTKFNDITTKFLTNSYKAQIAQKQTEQDVLKQRQQIIRDISFGKFGDLRDIFPQPIRESETPGWLSPQDFKTQDKYVSIMKVIAGNADKLKNVIQLGPEYSFELSRHFEKTSKGGLPGITLPTTNGGIKGLDLISKLFNIDATQLKKFTFEHNKSAIRTLIESSSGFERMKMFLGPDKIRADAEKLSGILGEKPGVLSLRGMGGPIEDAFNVAKDIADSISREQMNVLSQFAKQVGIDDKLVDSENKLTQNFYNIIGTVEQLNSAGILISENIDNLTKTLKNLENDFSSVKIGIKIKQLGEIIDLLKQRLESDIFDINTNQNQNTTTSQTNISTLPIGNLSNIAISKQTGGDILHSIFKPRGTDTVPAMLTPGEFIVNAKAAKRNKNLLQRINSDKIIYAQDGGILTDEERQRLLQQEDTNPALFTPEQLQKPTRLPRVDGPPGAFVMGAPLVEPKIPATPILPIEGPFGSNKSNDIFEADRISRMTKFQNQAEKNARRAKFEAGRGAFYKGREDRKTNFNRDEYKRIFGVGERAEDGNLAEMERISRKQEDAKKRNIENAKWIREQRKHTQESIGSTKFISYKEPSRTATAGTEFRGVVGFGLEGRTNYVGHTYKTDREIMAKSHPALSRTQRFQDYIDTWIDKGLENDSIGAIEERRISSRQRIMDEKNLALGRLSDAQQQQDIATAERVRRVKSKEELQERYKKIGWPPKPAPLPREPRPVQEVLGEILPDKSTRIKIPLTSTRPIEDVQAEFGIRTWANSGQKDLRAPERRGIGPTQFFSAKQDKKEPILGSTHPDYKSPAQLKYEAELKRREEEVKKPYVSQLPKLDRPLTMREREGLKIIQFAREHGLPGLQTAGIKIEEDPTIKARASFNAASNTIKLRNPRETSGIHEYGHALDTRYGMSQQGEIYRFLQANRRTIQKAAENYSRQNGFPITGNIQNPQEMLAFIMEGTDSTLLPLRAYLIEQMRQKEKQLRQTQPTQPESTQSKKPTKNYEYYNNLQQILNQSRINTADEEFKSRQPPTNNRIQSSRTRQLTVEEKFAIDRRNLEINLGSEMHDLRRKIENENLKRHTERFYDASPEDVKRRTFLSQTEIKHLEQLLDSKQPDTYIEMEKKLNQLKHYSTLYDKRFIESLGLKKIQEEIQNQERLQRKHSGGFVQYRADGGFIAANLLHKQEQDKVNAQLTEFTQQYNLPSLNPNVFIGNNEEELGSLFINRRLNEGYVAEALPGKFNAFSHARTNEIYLNRNKFNTESLKHEYLHLLTYKYNLQKNKKTLDALENDEDYLQRLEKLGWTDARKRKDFYLDPEEKISFSHNNSKLMKLISREISNIPKKHTGGFIYGSGDVPVMAQGGEFILDRASAQHFARGGLVQYKADGGTAKPATSNNFGEISINGIDSLDKLSQVFTAFINKSDVFVQGLDAGFVKFQSSIQSFEGAVGKLKDAFSTKIEISVTHNPIEVIVNGQVTGPDKDSIRQIVMETIGPELDNLTRNIKEFGPNALA